jgi:hypothetical protein
LKNSASVMTRPRWKARTPGSFLNSGAFTEQLLYTEGMD